jgi:putative ABC transport system permease protein
MSWLSGAGARLHLLFARRAAESRMSTEIGFHIEMETDRLVRDEGLSRDEARRRALATFGGVTQHMETLREGRGLAWLGGMSLDLKLGSRMLVKYPGLTVVGGLAMAFAICIGAVTFELVNLFVNPTLPLPNGERVVQIRNWDVSASREEPRALHDFIVWRGALRSVTDIGAYRNVTRNLIIGQDARAVEIAEITASAFRIAADAPLLGRVLVAADERAGAPPVVVIGYTVWRTRFASDPKVIGRSVQLGDAYATVVGVMREGFEFPVSHDLWMPLQPDILDQTPGGGPGIHVFGRLAPGATFEEAQAELTLIGRRMATDFPHTHKDLQPQVYSYAKRFWEPTRTERGLLLSIDGFAMMLLVLLCCNVALLLFARAASRETELIVRSALGASRKRIIAQLFAEALVLGGVASAIGLAAAGFGLRAWGRQYLEVNLGRLPFWYDPNLSPMTVLYALGLTVLAAGICGVMPALKVTRGLGSRLKEGTAGGGLRFGGVWTAVIVMQVAVTVAFPAVAYVEQRELVRIQSFDVGFPAREYLGVKLEADAPTELRGDTAAARAAARVRFGTVLETLRQRLTAEPGVAGVTFVDRLPRTYHPERRIELDDSSFVTTEGVSPTQQADSREVSVASVDASYFDVLEAPIITGRGFHASDLAGTARVAIVDEGFVEQMLLGRNPIGRRVRFAKIRTGGESPDEPPHPWYEIVGVVKDLGMGYVTHRGRAAGLYLPAAPGGDGPVNMVVHVKGDPMSLASKVRSLASAVDPSLRLSDLQRLDEVVDDILWILGVWLRVTAGLTAIALLLSLAGIYAVLSFTVARRTREIGVRVALGASRRRVVAAIFRRPLTQVGFGVAAGGALIGVTAFVLSEGGLSLKQLALLTAYAALMLGVCLLAAVVPTRRALRVEPTEALRAE